MQRNSVPPGQQQRQIYKARDNRMMQVYSMNISPKHQAASNQPGKFEVKAMNVPILKRNRSNARGVESTLNRNGSKVQLQLPEIR
jgi:hypothetical protein